MLYLLLVATFPFVLMQHHLTKLFALLGRLAGQGWLLGLGPHVLPSTCCVLARLYQELAVVVIVLDRK